MTLERHRSRLIPDVDFCETGRIFVTDTDGTFPLRHGKQPRDALPQVHGGGHANGTLTPPPDYDVQSYRSFDPQRDRGRKYKRQKSNKFGEELNNMTWGSGGSQSLQRKLRRLRGQGSIEGHKGVVTEDRRVSRLGTWSSAGKEKRRLAKAAREELQFPRKDGGYTNSFPRKGKRHSLDIYAIRDYKEQMHDRKSSIMEMYKKGDTSGVYVGGSRRGSVSAKQRRLAEERLPGVMFQVSGLVLLIMGAIKLLLCWWHAYFCLIWTGVVLLGLGISGATHKGEYFTKWRNGIYITLGVASSLCVMASCGLLMQVIYPTVVAMLQGNLGPAIAVDDNLVPFSNMHKSLAIQMDLGIMVYLNLAIDLASLFICFLNFFSLTAAIVAVVNHWDAVYKATGECDHRGHPTYFNPFEQIALGQATLLAGIFVMTCWQSTTYNPLWSPIWAASIVPIAGIVSLCFGKRPDSRSLGVSALVLQPAAISLLTVASVYVLLGLLDDIDHCLGGVLNSNEYGLRIASATVEAIYTFFVFINLVFVIGIIFRLFRRICCPRFLHSPRAPSSGRGSRAPSLG